MGDTNEQGGTVEERIVVFADFRLNNEMDFTYRFLCPDCKHKIEFRPRSVPSDNQFPCEGCGVEMSIDRKSLNHLEEEMYNCLNIAILENGITILLE